MHRLKHSLYTPIALALSFASLHSQQFLDVTSTVGISHVQHAIPDTTQTQYYYTGGACAGDYNNDGYVDLYVTVLDGADILYENQGGTGFAVKTVEKFGASHMATIESNGCAWGDIDNDGDLDLYVTSLGGNRYHLFVNSGAPNFTFTEEAVVRGADVSSTDIHYGTSIAFGDVNLDGFLDIYISEWRFADDNPLGLPHNNRLLLNDGLSNPGYFADVTFAAGVSTDAVPTPSFLDSQGFSPRILDMDLDGVPDILLAGDHGTSRLWWGNGDGTFLDGTDAAGVGTDRFGMGSTVGDFDRDGDFDWFVTSIYNSALSTQDGNRLYRNDGSREFTDVTDATGVRNGHWGWGTSFFDYDNDQDLDLIVTNGAHFPLASGFTAGFEDDPTVLFQNNGTGVFTNVAGTESGIVDNDLGKGLVLLDYDNDGDMDIYIANTGSAPVFYENQTDGSGDWLKLSFEGVASNRQGIGCIVNVVESIGADPILRFNDGGSNYLGQNSAGIHAGLGAPAATPIYAVIVRWPSGRVQVLSNVARNQDLLVVEPSSSSSTQIVLSHTTLLPGETLTAELGTENLPVGWTATWTIEGQTYTNPLSIILPTIGEFELLLEIFDDSPDPKRVWTESRRVNISSYDTSLKTIARLWNEQNLDAIRIDFPDPTKHARNLFHTSVAMWDTWAAFDTQATGYIHRELATSVDVEAARHEAISYAAYQLLKSRYADSVNANTTLARIEILMDQLGYDTSISTTVGTSPAALGNRVAAAILNFTSWDGWDDETTFLGSTYAPLNDPLPVDEVGITMAYPNHWQPLFFEEAITQNGIPTDITQTFLGASWGLVRPFALLPVDGSDLFIDPGEPPKWGTASEAAFKDGNLDVIRYSSLLDPSNSTMIDISPGSYGNNTLGLNDGTGHALNPSTGAPYPQNLVSHADLGRVLAEFWADGPESETPPGHWNVLANEVADHPDFERRFMGVGDELAPLEWDVRTYFVINAALHDCAVAAWGCKRVYDYVRPISSIRYLCSLGQSTNASGPSYHAGGIPLETDLVEVITASSSASGERHEHLSDHIGKIAIYAWLGEVADPENQSGGVGWILGEAWLPYQRSTFVTPAFAGYVSGHSTFSRAAAEVMTRLTGSEFFPGGMATFTAHQNEYLAFENGPSTNIELQWATYFDAADQAGLSRLYGGIHVPVDDGPGRIMGSQCGIQAWDEAIKYFDGSIYEEDLNPQLTVNPDDSIYLKWNSIRGFQYRVLSTPDFNTYMESTWQRSGDVVDQAIFDHLQNDEDKMFYIIEREDQL